jgi:hypothetical protein
MRNFIDGELHISPITVVKSKRMAGHIARKGETIKENTNFSRKTRLVQLPSGT